MKRSSEWLTGSIHNDDNLHLIAISNLERRDRTLQRWWTKKYKTPPRPFDEYTEEELMVEMLEDFYDKNPAEAQRFLDQTKRSRNVTDEDWNGEMPEEYQVHVVQKLQKFYEKNKVDLSRYKSDEQLTPEQEKKLLDDLGKNLPLSRSSPKKGQAYIGDDEFEESFEG